MEIRDVSVHILLSSLIPSAQVPAFAARRLLRISSIERACPRSIVLGSRAVLTLLGVGVGGVGVHCCCEDVQPVVLAISFIGDPVVSPGLADRKTAGG